jgi:hypothetical protein
LQLIELHTHAHLSHRWKNSSFRCTKRKALSTCLIYLARVRHTAWRKSTWLGLLIAFGTTEATSLVFHRRLWHNMDCVRSTLSSFDSNEAASPHSLFDRLIYPWSVVSQIYLIINFYYTALVVYRSHLRKSTVLVKILFQRSGHPIPFRISGSSST